METGSLSCLRSLGASVPFTSLYVLFKIYFLNLDSLEFWQWFELKRKCLLFALFPFLCLHVDVLFFCYNQTYWAVQYCRLQRAFCRDCMKTLFIFEMAEQNIGKTSAPFPLQILLKKKSPNVHFCVPTRTALNKNVIDSQLHFICFCLLGSWGQRSGGGVGGCSSIVCVETAVCIL